MRGGLPVMISRFIPDKPRKGDCEFMPCAFTCDKRANC